MSDEQLHFPFPAPVWMSKVRQSFFDIHGRLSPCPIVCPIVIPNGKLLLGRLMPRLVRIFYADKTGWVRRVSGIHGL